MKRGWLNKIFVALVFVIALGGVIYLIATEWGPAWVGIAGHSEPKMFGNQEYVPGKTLWDLLELLIVPLTLLMVVRYFNQVERKRDEKVSLERHQDMVFREWFDRMSQLILEKNLKQENKNSVLSGFASILTKTVLSGLDGYRKGLILKFLYDSNLVGKPAQERPAKSINSMNSEIVSLEGANFSGAVLQDTKLCEAVLVGVNLDGANLTKSDLSVRQPTFVHLESGRESTGRGAFLIGSSLRNACLRGANLENAVLDDAILVDADLREANLQGAYIRGRKEGKKANFEGANLEGANLTNADLTGAINFDKAINVSKAILKGTVMPDGKPHD